MSGLKRSQKAMMLISIIMLSVLLVMLTTSMISIVTQSSLRLSAVDSKLKALKAAEAGVEFALFQLNNDSTWGDVAHPVVTHNENIGNYQEFNIIFVKNNLINSTSSGSTPPYGAEILCEGIYRGEYIQKIKAMFMREEILLYPVTSEGSIFLDISDCSNKIQGGNPNDPGRCHSNKNIEMRPLVFPSACSMNLFDGILSACNNIGPSAEVSYLGVKTKTDVVPIKIPDINVTYMVNNRPPCTNIPANRFYLIGYFEFDGRDPNDPSNPDDPLDPTDDPLVSYCIPHWSPVPVMADPAVYGLRPYVLGMAEFDEDSYSDFINSYLNLQNSADKDITNPVHGFVPKGFWIYGTPPFTPKLNTLGMSLSFNPPGDPFLQGVEIILTLQDNLYLSGPAGFMETTWIDNLFPVYSPRPNLTYQLNNVADIKRTKIDFNGKIIYGDKLWLEIPPAETSGGGIVSNKNIDLIYSYNTPDFILFSQDDVNILNYPKYLNGTIQYNGIIYARDDIGFYVHGATSTVPVSGYKFNGAMASFDASPDNFTDSPMSFYGAGVPSASYSIYLDTYFPGMFSGIGANIKNTYDGLTTIADIRETGFKVRKQYVELIK